jgi:hypothetical protein
MTIITGENGRRYKLLSKFMNLNAGVVKQLHWTEIKKTAYLGNEAPV